MEIFPAKSDAQFLQMELPLSKLMSMIGVSDLRSLSLYHGYKCTSKMKMELLKKQIAMSVRTPQCLRVISVFQRICKNNAHKKVTQEKSIPAIKAKPHFPPSPPNPELIHQIITDWAENFNSVHIEEVGCAVCGQLKPCADMATLKSMKITCMFWNSQV